jgi:multiple sugar transport system ATP-binding protein
MGYVQQIGTPLELYDTPANVFVASFIGLPPMNFFEGKIEGDHFVSPHFTAPLNEDQKKLLAPYNGKDIILGARPENIVPNDNGYIPITVTLNENLGQTTLVHGNVSGHKITAKFREWCNYKPGDSVLTSINNMHFFDKETTNAIR